MKIGDWVKVAQMPKNSKYMSTPHPMDQMVGRYYKVIDKTIAPDGHVRLKLHSREDKEIFGTGNPEDFWVVSHWCREVPPEHQELFENLPVGSRVKVNDRIGKWTSTVMAELDMIDLEGEELRVTGFYDYDGVPSVVTDAHHPPSKWYWKFDPIWLSKIKARVQTEENEDESWGAILGGSMLALLGSALLKKNKHQEQKEEEKSAINRGD